MKQPAFVFVGAEKSGSTSLYRYLGQHPGVFMPPVKGLNYFTHHPGKRSFFQGLDLTFKNACRNEKDYFQAFLAAKAGEVIGEIGHIYLYAPEAADLIKKTLGEIKIVAILRNPIDRAYAQFAFHRDLQCEPLATFEEALDAEDGRVRAGWDPAYHYVRKGCYGQQLQRYFKYFRPENIRVYQFENFFREPLKSMADLYQFIGVDSNFVPDLSHKHMPSGDPRDPKFVAFSCEGLPPQKSINVDTKKRLARVFESEIEIVECLTGLDLADWRGDA